jgi:ATP-binding cassette subfamily C (CFTR/MRP) protein 1
MAITEDEKDWEQKNPVGVATNSAEHHESEPSDSDSSPDEVEFEKHENSEKQESKILPTAVRTQTTSTEITTGSDKTTEPETQKKPPWSKRLNPLKRNPPPVPRERQPSREYSANFFSKLTFQWISPLMSVSW